MATKTKTATAEKSQWKKEDHSLSKQQIDKLDVKAFNELPYYTRFFAITQMTDVKQLKAIKEKASTYLADKIARRIIRLEDKKLNAKLEKDLEGKGGKDGKANGKKK